MQEVTRQRARVRPVGWWLGVAMLVVAGMGIAPSSAAQGSEEGAEADKPDPVRLARMLVRDGHYGRAEKTLAQVDPSTHDDLDRAAYHTVRGIVALQKKAYRTAVEQLDEAIRHGQTDETIFVHLAQAHYGLKHWEKVVQMVRNADQAGRELPDMWLMRAESQRKLGRLAEAWRTLGAGRARFSDESAFLRQQVFLAVEMGLYREAMRRGQRFLERRDGAASPEEYIAISEAFRRAGAYEQAQALLEQARLAHPEHVELTVHLAHAYIDADELMAGAGLLQRAAEHEATYLSEAAALYRRAGAYERALYLNARIDDDREKFEQRVAILLDRKHFARIASMEARLSRLGLLSEQKILYALAYAHFQVRDFERAERLTRRIDDPDLFESAVKLRRAIETCRDQPWTC